MSEIRKTEYGLRHANGYVRPCASLQQALDLKSGRRIDGRRGDWVNHEVVSREVVTTYSDWEVAD